MNKEDIVSVLKGAGVAALGAALTWLTQWASNTDFGQYTPMVVAGLSVLVNVIRKYMAPTPSGPTV